MLLQPLASEACIEAGIGSKRDKDELILGLRLKFNAGPDAIEPPALDFFDVFGHVLLLIAAKAQSSKASAILLSIGSLADVST